jgi:predicted transcriptional regulator
MKTTQKTENRNNKVEKVLSRSAAVIVSFVLISFTVSAQGYWKHLLTNNSFGKMALLMVENSNAATSENTNSADASVPVESESSTFFIEPAVDETLDVEAWMTDDAHFGTFSFIFEPAIEKSLELEDWMKDESHFTSRFAVEREEELKLEAWMTDDAYWRL